MYTVNIEQYEGPLDLLLEIIEQKKIPLLTIRLSVIADDFTRYVKTLDGRRIQEVVDFLVIASRLVLLKSRELVPNDTSTDEDDGSMEELEQRLALYEPFRRGAKRLHTLSRQGKQLWAREAFANYTAIEYIPESFSGTILQYSAASLLANITLPSRIPQAEMRITISIEECITELQKIIRGKKKIDFLTFLSTKNKDEQIAHFVGMLELIHNDGVYAIQEVPFGAITLSAES